MLLRLLGAMRRLLMAVDAAITRRRFGRPYFAPPENAAALARWRGFFSRLDPVSAEEQAYRETHLERLSATLELVPPPGVTGRALELGCYMQMTPALAVELGYGEVRGAHLGAAGRTEVKTSSSAGREIFRCEVDLFDAERDPFPYPDGHFDCVLACEILEHLRSDPMHMLLELRRVLAEGGALVLTTPNCAGLGSVTRALHGFQNPQVYSCYPRTASGETPHVREYTAFELSEALRAAGLRVEILTTGRVGPAAEGKGAYELLRRYGFSTELRGEQIYCRARKDPSLAVERYPRFLYE